MTREERMTKIAERFPTLRRVPGVRPWNAEAFVAWIRDASLGSGTSCAARFVLTVWNGGNYFKGIAPFDFDKARSTWDKPHAEAFRAFVAEDWDFWP
jgi:hypothetical protein